MFRAPSVRTGSDFRHRFRPRGSGELLRRFASASYDETLRIDKLPADQHAERKKFFSTHTGDATRIYLGRGRDTSASLQLKDATGNTRLTMRVDADANPVIQFLNADGNVTSEFTSTKK